MVGMTFSTITDDVQRNELQIFYTDNYKRFIYIASKYLGRRGRNSRGLFGYCG